MGTIALMIVAFVGYLLAYHTYGKFLARRIFRLRDDATPASVELEDGIDFVPTRKGIIFGHHYTSIAGTGPIVGPAIGIIWGWVPAMLWVFVGSIFMGAVHDFGAVVISMRNKGKSISECAANVLGYRVKYILFAIIFLLLMIVIAIFGVVISAVFARFPQSVFPVWMEIPIAVALGWAIYKRKGHVVGLTVAAVFLMYVTVVMGHFIPVKLTGIGPLSTTAVWVIILLVYAFIASSLPVTTLLQPRDYINAWQLFVAMILLVFGVLASGFTGKLPLVAPAVSPAPEGAPPMLPFLFITIACGAISGFHSLVGSGTTSKQIASERDALAVGYGSMLLEGVLAILVIIAVAAGIGMAYETEGGILTGSAAWQQHYSSWAASKGLGSKITAVVIGSANMIGSLGVPVELGIVVMGVFIASFAGTTLDTSTRLQRYIVGELFSSIGVKCMTGRYAATAFAVLTAALLAFATGADGKGALMLWPMFGAGNQLLACLALLVITNYLASKGGYGFITTAIPCLIMAIITAWAVVANELNFVSKAIDPAASAKSVQYWLLAVINGMVLVLAAWTMFEGILALARHLGSNQSSDSAGDGPGGQPVGLC